MAPSKGISSISLRLFSSYPFTLLNLFQSFSNLFRVGRSDMYATEYDLEAEEYVPLPKGDVHKKKEIVQDVTLNDLDQVRLFLFLSL